jgi:hypothetical protein
MTSTDDLAAKVDALTATVDRLTRVIQSRLAPPARQLTYAQAERLGFSRRALERAVSRGVFTDDRPDKSGSRRVRLYEDELGVYRSDGESGVRRLREELGRI